MFRIYPYVAGSASVTLLKEALEAVVIKRKNSRYRYREVHTVINWGSTSLPDSLEGVSVINPVEGVAISANKLTTFEVLDEAGVATVPFTTDVDVAQAWLEGGHKVFAREKLNGHSGEGIDVVTPNTRAVYSEEQESTKIQLEEMVEVLVEKGMHYEATVLADSLEELEPEGMETDAELPDAPLYTQGVGNKGEYRVHVFDGEVILYQKKSRKVDEDGEVETAVGEDADVRNLASNWIYRTGNLNRLERIEELAISAVEALGLDFGAVDIINDNDNQVSVLEVNTAPGLSNSATLQAYTDAFNSLV